ncbi:SEFIR domain protein [Dictyocaulus viviparus]|uniref:SEFIR domain protein n=1 Tax=Dictyocaulus viviparus TaxID=29172 RepID=A0A0D8XNE4_DICVI|nr:SEFIR domain protein [Dictyocaulus viviparus]
MEFDAVTHEIDKVRLLDETGIELLRHAVIKAKDMRKEIIDGKTVYFGEYNFTGLEYGVDYIPSVIPVEMSSDGRCLCPTSEQHGACSCIAADWKRVRLQRIEKANPVINSTTPVIIRSRDESRYCHDCPQHEAAVIALAELLRDSFQMDVHLDVWDLDIIERNLCDYVNSSIMKADKIIVINSVGSYYRLRARYLGEETIERVQKSPLDDLFLSQIDLVLQHANVISARFNYTPPAFTLFALSPLLQFMIPENLGFFIASLNESQLRNDPRLVGFDPQLANLHTAIATMTELIENEPKWFETTHYRVKRMTSRPKTPINASDRMSSQSAFVDRPFTNEPLIIHTRRSDVMNSSENNVVVAVRPLDDDVRPLLQESNELEFNEKQNDNVSPYSTFHSDIFVDKVPSKIQVNGNSSLSVRTHYDILQDDEVANEPIGRENDTTTDNDSGMVSDLTSGQLSV